MAGIGVRMKIAHRLNAKRVRPPLYGTKHVETRKAWAITSVHCMLRNPIYTGRVVWNRGRQFFDGDNEKRQATERPEAAHIVREDPSLRIVPPEIEQAIAARHAMWRERYGAGRPGRFGRNNAGVSHVAHSQRHLLTGMLRCGTCDARMVAVTTTRKKPSGVYQRGWYYCPVSRTKGEAVCGHRARYRKDQIEFALTSRAMEAVNRKNVSALVEGVNAAL
jgi:site-specific DNA recombinase